HAVAVIVVILGGVDTALRGDAVSAARRILKAETLDVVTQLGQSRGCRTAGQARPHHDDRVLPLVRGIHQLETEAVPVPAGFDRAGRRFRIELHADVPQ